MLRARRQAKQQQQHVYRATLSTNMMATLKTVSRAFIGSSLIHFCASFLHHLDHMHYRWHYYNPAPVITFHLHHFMYYLSSSHLGDFRVSLLWHDAHFYNDFRCGLIAASFDWDESHCRHRSRPENLWSGPTICFVIMP